VNGDAKGFLSFGNLTNGLEKVKDQTISFNISSIILILKEI